MKRFVETLLYLWQLPQNLAGLLLVAVFGWCSPIDYRGNNHRLPSSLVFIREKMRGGISLGRYIIMPSILWAAWWNEDRNRDYYSFYTERWADRLGGVERC